MKKHTFEKPVLKTIPGSQDYMVWLFCSTCGVHFPTQVTEMTLDETERVLAAIVENTHEKYPCPYVTKEPDEAAHHG